MPKLVLVVNPFASRVTQAKLAAVQQELARIGDTQVLLTERPGHATELVAEACSDGVDAVLVFSGDGGFNEALNGLGDDIPIGFLPGGGTSVLSRALGLPADPVKAAQQIGEAIEQQRTRRITVGRVNGRRFAFGAGIGLDAEAVRRVDEMGRTDEGRRPGDLAFALAIVRALAVSRGHMEPRLEVKGIGRAAFVIIANGTPYTYAKRIPLPIAPEAQFELGLDLVAPVRLRRRSLLNTATSVLTGRVQQPRRGPVRPRPRPAGDRLRRADAASRRRRGPRRRRGGRVRGRTRGCLGPRLNRTTTLRPMAQVAPGEHELRRVIDEDREVEGLGEQELLDLYRSMVLLRTYDERSLVYHRQGRIGTYAMFWNHEAMQAGSAHALARRGLDLPELPRVGDRAAARDSRRRRCSAGGAAIPPAGGTRPSTTSRRSACRSRRRCRTPPGSRGARS